MVEHHLQQGGSASRGHQQHQQAYETENDTFSVLHKNNKLFEAHRMYADRMKSSTDVTYNNSSSSSQQPKSNSSKNMSSTKPSDKRHHQDVTKTVSNSSASTIDKMYVNPGFHLSYSPSGVDANSSNKNYLRNTNNELPSDVEICEVDDGDNMNMDIRSDSYEHLRNYPRKNDNVSGDVSLVGDLPPIHQSNRKNQMNFQYPNSKQIQPNTHRLKQSDIDNENMFDDHTDFKLSTSSNNYRQTSTSTSNSSDHGNNSRNREGADIAILRGGVARNNQHGGEYSKNSKMSNRHSTSTASSNNSREASDPMSLDSGVITTLSRSVSPMSSSNPGSTGSQHSRGRRDNLLSNKSNEIEEETNVDGPDNNAPLNVDEDDEDDQDVVDVADTSTDDSSSIGAGSTGDLNSTTRSAGATYYKGARMNGSLLLGPSQGNPESRKNNGYPTKNQFVPNNKRITNDNATISGTPSAIGRNGRHDPLTKLYDNAVLKIPKVMPSDSDSLYSECNNYSNSIGKGFGHALNSLDSKKHRLLLTNGGPDTSGVKNGSNKGNKRLRKRIETGPMGESNVDGKVQGDLATNDSSFDTEDHDNSYESIKCDENLTNDEAVDTAADSETGGDNITDVSHRSLYINKYMSNSLKASTKTIPEMDEEGEDNPTHNGSREVHSIVSTQTQNDDKFNPYTKSISSMDKMIVKIGGNENGNSPNGNASVYSGRLLIEVAGNNDYGNQGNSKPNRSRYPEQGQDKNNEHSNNSHFQNRNVSKNNNFRINGAVFDPDTLDRGGLSSSEFNDDSLERPNKNKKRVENKDKNNDVSGCIMLNRENPVPSSFNSIGSQHKSFGNGYTSSPAPPSEIESCSTNTTYTASGNNTDYSFRLFENGQLLTSTDVDEPSYGDQKHANETQEVSGGPTSLPSLPPALPPKKSKSQTSLIQSNLYENEEETDMNESVNTDYGYGKDNGVPSNEDEFDPNISASKRQKGLTAERKQYFERLNSGKDFSVSVNSNSPRKLWETNCV